MGFDSLSCRNMRETEMFVFVWILFAFAVKSVLFSPMVCVHTICTRVFNFISDIIFSRCTLICGCEGFCGLRNGECRNGKNVGKKHTSKESEQQQKKSVRLTNKMPSFCVEQREIRFNYMCADANDWHCEHVFLFYLVRFVSVPFITGNDLPKPLRAM